jgi:hypothetical protein
MRLIPHESTNHPNVKIESKITVEDLTLKLKYIIVGDILSLKIPKYGDAKFTHGLWNATCFELFLVKKEQNGYVEFNFSPSKEWAIYEFSDYRQKTGDIENITPFIEFFHDEYSAEMIISFDISTLTMIDFEHLSGAFSVVLLTNENELSYWARKHLKDKADFHDLNNFSLF